jgi:transcriptional regulator with XRE-family HTH domain
MSPRALVEGRTARRWTQVQAAKLLGISQSYLSMIETGERSAPPALARRAAKLYRLPPTDLALPAELDTDAIRRDLAGELAALGYPGFSYVRAHGKRNPAEVLLLALARKDLDPRVTEALPWLLLRYPEVDWRWITRQAKLHDLQNRLGFVTNLARRLAESQERYREVVPILAEREAALEPARLQREDTLCRESMTEPERKWLRAERPPEAVHWNLLTGIAPHQLRYVA